MKYDKIVAINKEKSREKAEIAINEIEKNVSKKRAYFCNRLIKKYWICKKFFLQKSRG